MASFENVRPTSGSGRRVSKYLVYTVSVALVKERLCDGVG